MIASPVNAPAAVSAPRPQLALNTNQVAVELGCSYSTAKELIRKGTIRSFKMGGCRRVRYVDLQAYVNQLAEDAA